MVVSYLVQVIFLLMVSFFVVDILHNHSHHHLYQFPQISSGVFLLEFLLLLFLFLLVVGVLLLPCLHHHHSDIGHHQNDDDYGDDDIHIIPVLFSFEIPLLFYLALFLFFLALFVFFLALFVFYLALFLALFLALLLGRSLGRVEHCAAALRTAATTREDLIDVVGVVLLAADLVVVAELLALGDLTGRLDEHASLLDHGLAVAVAGVVDETRGVAAHARIDDDMSIDDEQEGVVVVRVVVLVTVIGFLVRDAVAEILDDARPFGDAARGEHALAVDGGFADLDPAAGTHLGDRHGEGSPVR